LQLVDGLSNFSFNYAKVVIKGESNASDIEKMKYNVFKGFLTEANLDHSKTEGDIKQNFNIQNDKLCYISDKSLLRLDIS